MAARAASMSPFKVTFPVPLWYPAGIVYSAVLSPTDPLTAPLFAMVPVTFPLPITATLPVRMSAAVAFAPEVSW